MAITTAPSQDLKADKAADFGDEVKTEEEQSDVEAIAEPWEKYDLNGTPHVFYPLCLGEVLDERYLVEHKIGFGGFSTVWMAHDLKTKTDVALKIFSLGEWGEHETHMQNEILQNVQDTSNLVTCSASFLLPAGSSKSHHRVLVLPLVGPSIAGGLGKVIFARLYFGFLPFPDQGQGGEVSSMVRCLGPLPEQWKGLFTHSGALDYWYDQCQIPDPKYSLAAKISKFRPEADQTEQKHMLSIMSKVFTFCPQKRLTATQLLHDPSFKAIMEKYGC
ncbi:protein kinase [Histoplasma capsulatum var. duboisii H88]|uniref:Protein kinase n=1 Tax=Ajellomyces capsulatus (strain H88) TaxID=544711 RepID=F0UBV2_AJEC8|nr:protein kinase [Histoplasma capsulatum var. duboisii H88]